MISTEFAKWLVVGAFTLLAILVLAWNGCWITLFWSALKKPMNVTQQMQGWQVRLWKDKAGKNQVDIIEALAWPSVDVLIHHIRKHFKAIVTHRKVNIIEGGGIWHLRIEGKKVVVEQSDWGGDINVQAKDSSGEELIEKIADSITAAINGEHRD